MLASKDVAVAYLSTGSALGSASMFGQSLSNSISPKRDAKKPGTAFMDIDGDYW